MSPGPYFNVGATGRDAAILLGGLVGRWSSPARASHSRDPASDPLACMACLVDAPATHAGPLGGMTVAVKDNVAVAGAPSAIGSGLPGFVAPRDATLVARIRAAGGQIVAKAQCEAFLLGANSFTSRPSPVRNPHDRARSAGGSSSGSAAIIAGGLSDLAIGTDSGGSIRIPAAYCGIVGFKPTRGRVPYTGVAPLEPFLECAGPMARTVEGVARLFTAIDGPDGIDPRAAWSRNLDRRIGEVPRLGYCDRLFGLADADVAAELRIAIDRLVEAGVVIVKLDWPHHDEALDLAMAIYLAGQRLVASQGGACAGFAVSEPDGWSAWRANLRPADLPEPLNAALDAGANLLARDPGIYARAIGRALEIADDLDILLAPFDAMLLPTVAGVAPTIPIGVPTIDELFGDTRLTAGFNVTGSPAISLPAGGVSGLPIGLQLVSRRGDDRALLELAARLEPHLRPIRPPAGDFGALP